MPNTKTSPDLRPRSAKTAKTAKAVAEPDHDRQLSEEERAMVARLVRVVRHQSYWLSGYIAWLLDTDSRVETDAGVTIDAARKMLDDIKGLNSWADWFQQQRSSRAPILRYFGHRFFPDAVDNLQNVGIDNNEEVQFFELARMWRLEHPAEPKRPAPAGCLGTKDEED